MTVLFVVANLPDFSLGFILLVILYSGKRKLHRRKLLLGWIKN